tara:strand:+ start:38 stop:241 length:204 start_codon:yes stop_codon:yes gene_type:complete
VIDLNHYFEQYNSDLSHHRAAIIELMRSMPEDLLKADAEWICIFESAESEWGYNRIVSDLNSETNKR